MISKYIQKKVITEKIIAITMPSLWEYYYNLFKKPIVVLLLSCVFSFCRNRFSWCFFIPFSYETINNTVTLLISQCFLHINNIMRNDGTVSYFQDTYLSPLLQNQKCLEEEENLQSNFKMEKLWWVVKIYWTLKTLPRQSSKLYSFYAEE